MPLKSGQCGLTDGSVAGNWRLPNVKELQSLIDFAYSKPALSNAVGTGQFINWRYVYWRPESELLLVVLPTVRRIQM